MDESPCTTLDLPLPPRWRQWIPAWLRGLVWADRASRYDAFLSYSWAADRKIAPVVQSVIQHFLCPWYRLREKVVFRDLSSLPAGSSLEDELRRRLDLSTHLIVLASPEAVHSAGVDFEVRYWCARPREGQVLVVLTKGNFQSWHEVRQHALPQALQDHLRSEPLWIDLSRRRHRILNAPSDPTLRNDLTEDLSQLLLRLFPGYDWGQLRGVERSQRRSKLLLMSAFVFVVVSLSGLFAWKMLDARRQKLAGQSRALASSAERLIARDQGEALSVAIDAWRTAQTEEAHLAVAHVFPQLIETLPVDGEGLNHVEFSRDGKRILTASIDGGASVWEASRATALVHLEDRANGVENAAFSPDGTRIVTAGRDGHTRIWDAATGRPVASLRGHGGSVQYAAFAADGLRIVTTNQDGTAEVWSATGDHMATLKGHGDVVGYAEFSRDGTTIVTASDDGTARMWSPDGRLLKTTAD